MKNYSLTILAFLISLSALCQEEPRFSISVAGGKSLSLRKAYTKLTGDQRGELAGDGLAAQLGLNYRFLKHIGLAARMTYNQNHTREEGIALVAWTQYNISNPTITDNKDWVAVSAMIGPYLSFELGRLGFEGRILAGYCAVKGPDFSLSGLFLGRGISAVNVTGTAKNFGYGAGATLSFKIVPSVSIIANADFAKTDVVFKNASGIATSGSIIVPQNYIISQTIGVMNVTGGLKFSF